MATIKSFTDIEQSKKLAKILPLESADMYWSTTLNTPVPYLATKLEHQLYKEGANLIPCWSLTALLGVLPILDNRSPVMSKTFDGKYRVIYHSTAYEKAIYTEDFDNPVDACYEMVLKLNELKML